MNRIILFCLVTLLFSCTKKTSVEKQVKAPINLLTSVAPINPDGSINAIIEIPAGTIEKWEVNKTTGIIEWETVNGNPRLINYMGYPGNYGYIPQTLLPKEKGGDGDPLDIIIIGSQAERSSIVRCKIIGILKLLDRGEQDDKIIAVAEQSSLSEVDDLDELNEQFDGISLILETWFTNYKGKGKMKSHGFESKKNALETITISIEEYKNK